MITVSDLWRYPIKSHGREMVQQVNLVEGRTMPWDRHWAVTHAQSKFDPGAPTWVPCRNFMIGVVLPKLAAIWARFDEATGLMSLHHADLGEITFSPDDVTDAARFLEWVAPLSAATALTPTSLVNAGGRGLTDSAEATISVMNHASHAAVSARLGGALEQERWRGNIWLEGLAPWEETEWVGQQLSVGGATLEVIEPIERCKHTMANPVTGTRDADTLGALDQHFGHQHFGMNCKVISSGLVATGDAVKVI